MQDEEEDDNYDDMLEGGFDDDDDDFGPGAKGSGSPLDLAQRLRDKRKNSTPRPLTSL